MVMNQSATDTASERDIENGVMADTSPSQRFAQCSGIGVVLDGHRGFGDRFQPLAQWELRPTLDLMRATDLAGIAVHRSAEPDAHGADRALCAESGEALVDLLTDAGATLGAIHRESMSCLDDAIGVALDDLELGATDLDSKTALGCGAQQYMIGHAPHFRSGPGAVEFDF